MGAVTSSYRASSNLTVTNLASIATSSTWVAGWISGVIDNTTNLDLDIAVSGKIALGNAATAGEIRMYAFAMLDDSNWPALLSAGTAGTEGTATVTTTTIRDAGMVLVFAAATRADPGTDDVYPIPMTSLRGAFGGFLPPKTVLFVTHSTGVNLAASGQQITVKGITESVA
jgi:hypothetical protein